MSQPQQFFSLTTLLPAFQLCSVCASIQSYVSGASSELRPEVPTVAPALPSGCWAGGVVHTEGGVRLQRPRKRRPRPRQRVGPGGGSLRPEELLAVGQAWAEGMGSRMTVVGLSGVRRNSSSSRASVRPNVSGRASLSASMTEPHLRLATLVYGHMEMRVFKRNPRGAFLGNSISCKVQLFLHRCPESSVLFGPGMHT